MTSKDLSIIIVDDLQFSRIVVKTALKKAGYNGVRMADSATEALAMIKQKHGTTYGTIRIDEIVELLALPATTFTGGHSMF